MAAIAIGHHTDAKRGMGIAGSSAADAQAAEAERLWAINRAKRAAATRLTKSSAWVATQGWLADNEIRQGDAVRIVSDTRTREDRE